ncbi:ABC transporter ATP-binding protein [Brucepastera parasyntrophica]|uniref:oligopeptide/dipeptide ABC transporter ATP-binding protein n=1 Tax=Brucepastera parasyntrophica TaxID=2880008 RepID=UPI00210C72CF|nr:ABC transporter ATP-binding protein [Brucepastera parasyntrophica]ULQ58799.1 ABC transporter ATP-binding protein [Brucepastera parasyntrophica]
MAIIQAVNLKKKFNLEAGFFARFGRFVYAVNDVSFSIEENETYGLVGESGCGKTTTARLLVRMYEPDEGSVLFHDRENVLTLKRKGLRQYREKVKYIFQDPARSLNPRMTVYEVLVSGYRWSSRWPGEQKARAEAASIMEEVGMAPSDLERRPAEFSGGQRQRISIARGLIMQPSLLICDEVVSALDVSIQGQILNLLLDIRGRRNLSFLFIAHDLKVACYFCDRIGVMYRGELMEEASAADLYEKALHPYTKLLFSSVAGKTPAVAQNEMNKEKGFFQSEVKTPVTELAGCAFAERCPLADEGCFSGHPELRILPGEENKKHPHKVRCFKV